MNRERTFWRLVEERAEATPDALFAIDEHDRSLDFAGYRDAALRCAAGLHDLGVGAETPVSWMLPSTLDAMVLCGALARLGAVQNPILPIYRERETGFILDQTAARLLCVPALFRGFEYAAMARSLAAEREGLEALVVDDGLPDADPSGLPAHPEPAAAQEAPVRWILYTSGTTSDPKGAQHTDAGLIAAFEAVARALALESDDRHAMVFPITHVGGIGWMIAGLLTGCAQIVTAVFDPERTIEVLARHGVTQAGAGPAFYRAYLEAQRATPGKPLFPRIRAFPGGGEPKPPRLHDDLKRELGGAGIVSGYGLTECPAVAMNRVGDSDEKLATTEGRSNPPEAEIRVVKGDGVPAGPGEEGELRVRAPQLFRGYLDPALDADAFDDDGFFRTGDLGRLDADGYVVVTGRLKDVIIRKGENISAREIEDLLYAHPKVADVAVIGLPDPALGERCCAVVACRDEPLGFDEMVEYLTRQRLARQKLPEQLERVDCIPRNDSGKIEKRALRERFAPGSREPTAENIVESARDGRTRRVGGARADDRAAVIDTVNRYATALDSRDWSLLDEVFTVDAVGEFGGRPLVGREALRDMVRRSVGRGGPSQHLLANHRVELGEDSARCVCQVRAFSAGTGPSTGQRYELFGEYRDQLVRTPDGWRIARRQMTIHHEMGSRDVLTSGSRSADSYSGVSTTRKSQDSLQSTIGSSTMSTESRTALITGASSGIGAAIATEMAALGWKIAIGARRPDRLAETAEKARAQGAADVYAGALDVTDDASVERFFAKSEEALGVADVIVNNAGASRFHWFDEIDPKWYRSELETNLLGPMLVTHRALSPLLAAGTGGDVLMVSSDAACRPRPGQLAYGASKAGLENYATALSMSLEGTGVRVIKLRLGPTISEFGLSMDLTPEGTRKRTEYWAQFGLRDARMMAQGNLGLLMPDDVAREVVRAVTQPRHVLIDTIELQPSVPQLKEGDSTS